MTNATIESVTITNFATTSRTSVDAEGHAHPSKVELPAIASLLTIRDTDGNEGHFTPTGGDYLRDHVVQTYIEPILLGKDPLRREQIWNDLYLAQRGSYGHLHDRALAFVEMALWDLAGRRFGVPVWKLAGGFRDKVQAYASTMCGDEVPGGLSSPGDYAAFAEQLAGEGYRGIKLHTWMPPVSFAPDVKMDIAACAAVREAVGPDVQLMLDPHHWYNRTDALHLAKEISKLGFTWMEEPMDEYSMSSYKWLVEQVDVLVAGPESVDGKFRSRAEWAASGSVDILRIGALSAGGISAALKVCALAEGFGMDCEIHGGGSGALALVGSAPNARWYERGLLHPHYDYETPPPHLHSIIDPIDTSGNVELPDLPGLGDDINFEYIEEHRIV